MRLAAPSLLLAAALVGVGGAAAAAELRVGIDAATVQGTVDLAGDGDVVVVPEGTWAGPVVVRTRLTLRGDGGVLDGGGRGTVLRIEAAGATVEGLGLRGSGDDLSGPDACLYVAKGADDVVIRGNTLHAQAFGVWLHAAKRVTVADNRIFGAEDGHQSDLGNAVQLFDADHAKVIGNHISGGRDGVYVSATDFSFIERNEIERTRYGVHYMFSYDNTVRANVATHNGSGLALMGSHRIVATDNVATDNQVHGILFRDVQYSTITGNRLERNGMGLFFYSSTENVIADNLVRHNEVGAKIWAGSYRNKVSGNRFVGNRRQIFYVSTFDLVLGEEGPGNMWSDYFGWDQDGDGVGDRPYRVDSFSAHLVHKYPAAVLLMRSPALELLTHLQERMPVLKVATVIDKRPLVGRRGGR